MTTTNSLLTISQITNEAVRLFTQSNAFLRTVSRQYDDQFARTGAKIGSTLRVRLPNDYTVSTGPAITPQGTNEQNTTLTVATQANVPVSFGTAEKTMQLYGGYAGGVLFDGVRAYDHTLPLQARPPQLVAFARGAGSRQPALA